MIDEFSTFLAVGTDTTAKLVTMMVYYIAKNPKIHKRLKEEINSIIQSDKDITNENLKNSLTSNAFKMKLFAILDQSTAFSLVKLNKII